jgi:hypothetical protein
MAQLSEQSPYTTQVQGGLVDGRFMSAAFTLIAAGPPRLANLGGATAVAGALSAAGSQSDGIAFPIGVVQNFSLSHNRQFNRFWEIGSERSFFVSGRTVGQMGLSRVMYHGPSLLRVLYAYYQDLIDPTLIESVFENIGVATVGNPHDVQIPPGYGNIFLNLASDLFSQPVGVLLYLRDADETTMGAIYLESVYVPNHTIAADANGVVIQENTSLQFERGVPVAVNQLSLIRGAASELLGLT